MLQTFLQDLALTYVLDLGDEVQRLAFFVVHQRDAQENPTPPGPPCGSSASPSGRCVSLRLASCALGRDPHGGRRGGLCLGRSCPAAPLLGSRACRTRIGSSEGSARLCPPAPSRWRRPRRTS